MPEPLTRETLEELRRLRSQQGAARRLVNEAEGGSMQHRIALAEWRARRSKFRGVLDLYLDSLLAAAERGLGAGDGR